MKRLSRFTVLIIFASVISCSSGGSIKQIVKPSTPLKSFNSMQVKVKLEYPDIVEDRKERAMLEKLIIEKIRAASPLKISDKGELKLDVTITEIKKINQTERVLLGALAGKARVKAIVNLSTLDSGKMISQFEVEGTSSGGSIFAGTTEQAVDMTAEYIVKEIVN
ncbi:MAG TPA: DUF4410 domain-containing protein [Spirochaetota bacterium]|nr:DUF4410 domain-containing protein [Spirochaetota bacterium]